MDVMDLQMEGLMLEASPVKSEEGSLVVFSRPGSSDGDVAEIRTCVSERDLPQFKLDSTIWPMQPAFLNKSGSPGDQQQVDDDGNENENNTSDVQDEMPEGIGSDLGDSEPYEVSVDVMDTVEDILQKCLSHVGSSSSSSSESDSDFDDFDDTIARLLDLGNSFEYYDQDDSFIPDMESMSERQLEDRESDIQDVEMTQIIGTSEGSSQDNADVERVANGVEHIALVVDEIADEEFPGSVVQMPQDDSRLTVPEIPAEIYASFYPAGMTYLPEGLEEHIESVAVGDCEDVPSDMEHYFDYDDSASDEDSITVTISPSASRPSAEIFNCQHVSQVTSAYIPAAQQGYALATGNSGSSSTETKEEGECLEKKRVSFHEITTEIEPSGSSGSSPSDSPPFCMGCAFNCSQLDEVTLCESPNPNLRPSGQPRMSSCRRSSQSRSPPVNAFQPIVQHKDPVDAQRTVVKSLREEVISLKFEVKSLQNRLREVQMDRERYQNACARLEKQLVYAFNFRDIPDAACMMREGPPMPPYMMMPGMRPMDPHSHPHPHPHPGYMPPSHGRPNFFPGPPYADQGFPRKSCPPPPPPPGMLQPMAYPAQDFSPRHGTSHHAPNNYHDKREAAKITEQDCDDVTDAKMASIDYQDGPGSDDQGAAKQQSEVPEERARGQFRNRSSSYGSNRFYNRYEGLDSHDWSKVRNSRRSLDGCQDTQDTMSSQGDYSSRGSRDRGRGRGGRGGRGGRSRGFGRGWSREGVRMAEAGKGLDRCWRSLSRV